MVGVLDGGKTAFDSEIWGDVEQMMQAFRRLTYSSVIAKLASPSSLDALKARLDNDPRLKVDVKREAQFYADQSASLSRFITILGMALSVIFSIGAMIGAAITMYSAVATRTAEIGTLRALGFPRASILLAFLIESLLLALVGGLVGLLAASFLTAITISTTNFQSFSELAFAFTLTPRYRRVGTRIFGRDGVRWRVPARHQGEPDENCRRTACGLARSCRTLPRVPKLLTPIAATR